MKSIPKDLTCLNCNGRDFKMEFVCGIYDKYRDKRVAYLAHVCQNCKEPINDVDQMNRLKKVKELKEKNIQKFKCKGFMNKNEIENKEPDFAFEKNLFIGDHSYDNDGLIIQCIAKLIFFIKEHNLKHNLDCKFFRLEFRYPYFDEEMLCPRNSLILNMKWGSKRELKKKDKENENTTR